jgi:hypothetical protein
MRRIDISRPLRVAEHEGCARALASSATNLNCDREICEFLVNFPLTRPKRGCAGQILDRAKILRRELQDERPRSVMEGNSMELL